MLQLIPVQGSDKDLLDFIETVYIDSFPPDERREFETIKELLENNEAFNLLAILSDDQPVGLLSYWIWHDMAYIEHFAVDDKWRGSGFGAETLKLFLAQKGMPVVLEVEKPEDDFSKRRIGFYERLGFRLWPDHFYIQPAYAKDKNALELHLMTHGEIDLNISFEEVRDRLHIEVYKAHITD